MNKIDAQAFLKDAAGSFEQLRVILGGITKNIDSLSWSGGSDNAHKTSALGLAGAGLHIAEDMAEVVGCWADKAGEPWLEDSVAVHADNNKPEATGRSTMDSNELGFELCGVKALIDAADRAIWQDGAVAEDSRMVIDATYILRDASAKLSKLLEKT